METRTKKAVTPERFVLWFSETYPAEREAVEIAIYQHILNCWAKDIQPILYNASPLSSTGIVEEFLLDWFDTNVNISLPSHALLHELVMVCLEKFIQQGLIRHDNTESIYIPLTPVQIAEKRLDKLK